MDLRQDFIYSISKIFQYRLDKVILNSGKNVGEGSIDCLLIEASKRNYSPIKLLQIENGRNNACILLGRFLNKTNLVQYGAIFPVDNQDNPFLGDKFRLVSDINLEARAEYSNQEEYEQL
jgi:hypothetical protein